jgi:hypothetical protein
LYLLAHTLHDNLASYLQYAMSIQHVVAASVVVVVVLLVLAVVVIALVLVVPYII